MKTLKRHLFLTLLLLGAAVYSCKQMNPFEGVNLVVNNEFFLSPLLIELVDANPDNRTFPENVTVRITGPGKNMVLDDTGGKNYKAVGNIIPLVLAANSAPSEAKPIVFTVELSAPGYLSTSQKFTIVNEQAERFEIAMVNLLEPPKGVNCKETTVPVSGGEISVMEAQQEIATIKLEAGTQVQDEEGQVINSSNLNAEVVVFDAVETEALNAFPGGLVPEQVRFNGGTNEDIGFVSAGFVAVNMEANGKEIKSFSKPIEVNMAVSSSIQNPETGEFIQEGSVIPTWSYETSTGEWSEEGEAIVTKGPDGQLIATFYASHLSYWNLDYFYRLGAKCGRRYTDILVSSNTNTYQRGFYGYLYDGSGNYITRNYLDIRNGTVSRIYNPRKSNLKMVVKDDEGNVFGETAVFDPCSQASVPVTVNVPGLPESTDVAIDFSANCANQNIVLKPSAWVVLVDPSYTNTQWFYMSGGKANVKVVEGIPYGVLMYYQGKALGGSVTFSKTGSTATPVGSDGIVATTSYDASSKVIAYNAVYEVNNCK